MLFFEKGNVQDTLKALTNHKPAPFSDKFNSLTVSDDALLSALLHFLFLAVKTVLPCNIADFFLDLDLPPQFKESLNTDYLSLVTTKDLSSWTAFYPLLIIFYEKSTTTWPDLHFSSQTSVDLYSWATKDFPTCLALGLAVFLFQALTLAWDFCLVKPSRSLQFFWSNSTFLFIPSTDGPFLISPLNWFFAFICWKGFTK